MKLVSTKRLVIAVTCLGISLVFVSFFIVLNGASYKKEPLVATSSTTTEPITSQAYFELKKPFRELPESIKDARQFRGREGYESYGDEFGTYYVQVFNNKEPFWDCDLYYTNGTTIIFLPQAAAKFWGCLDIYTDGHGAWYAVDPGVVAAPGETRVYRLQQEKVHEIRGLEELRGLDLYFDTTTAQWYGRWAKAGATPESVSTRVWHLIQFPLLAGDVAPTPILDTPTIESTTPVAPVIVAPEIKTPTPIRDTATPYNETIEQQVEIPTITPTVFPFPATYISSVVWPPQIVRSSSTVADCLPNGLSQESSEVIIAGILYCKRTSSEGAAGSSYRTFSYDSLGQPQTTNITFTLRYTNCGVYNEPKKSQCENEQSTIDIETLLIAEIELLLQR